MSWYQNSQLKQIIGWIFCILFALFIHTGNIALFRLTFLPAFCKLLQISILRHISFFKCLSVQFNLMEAEMGGTW